MTASNSAASQQARHLMDLFCQDSSDTPAEQQAPRASFKTSAGFQEAEVVNLSSTGCFLATSTCGTQGEKFPMTLLFPGELTEMALWATISEIIEGEYAPRGMKVEFSPLGAFQKARMDAYVAKALERQLHGAGGSRREKRRVGVDIPITVHRGERDISCVLLNVSLSGVLFSSPVPFELGSRCVLSMTHPVLERKLHFHVQIVRCSAAREAAQTNSQFACAAKISGLSAVEKQMIRTPIAILASRAESRAALLAEFLGPSNLLRQNAWPEPEQVVTVNMPKRPVAAAEPPPVISKAKVARVEQPRRFAEPSLKAMLLVMLGLLLC